MSTFLREAGQMAAQIGHVADQAGTAATIRRTVGAAGGTPWAGTAETPTVQSRPTRLINLRPATVKEVMESGGTLEAGDQVAFCLDDIQPRDTVSVRGAEWQVASRSDPAVLNGQRGVNVVLRRQGA